MVPIRGLLFDKDGTLFDFTASWRAVVDRTLDAVSNSDEQAAEMAQAVGYLRAERKFLPGSIIVAGAVDEFAAVWGTFRPDLGASRIEVIANEIVEEAVAGGALEPAVPDLRGLLLGLKDQGYVLGVATHDSEAGARDQVARHEALDCFSFIAGYDSGVGLKPGPGMMNAFCAATDLRPSECVMIGDSVHDLGVASAAGAAMAIGVLTGPAERKDLEHLADHILNSIGELPALLAGLRE